MKKITLFTTTTCAYCKMVKKFLDLKKLAYEVVNLDEHPERQDEAFKKSGSMTVPITLVEEDGNEQIAIGYNIQRLVAVTA